MVCPDVLDFIFYDKKTPEETINIILAYRHQFSYDNIKSSV